MESPPEESPPEERAPEERVAFDGRQPPRDVGHFVLVVDDGAWQWSGGMYMLHGYAPGEVPPTTDLLLHHKHPDDRARAASVLDDALVRAGEFSCYHRVVRRDGSVRSVLSVGRSTPGRDGAVERVEGYFVDLTGARRTETEAEVQEALVRIAEHREVIAAAKGMVMIALGCDSDEAFDCLRHHSQTANVKLHDIAHRIVDAVTAERRGVEVVNRVLAEVVR